MNMVLPVRSRKRNLWQATPAIALTTAVVVLLIGVAIAVLSDRAYREQKIREISVQGRILASTVTAALAFNDKTAAEEYVAALQVNPEMLHAAVYDSTGAVFAHFSRRQQEALPPRPPGQLISDHDGRLTVLTPVIQGTSKLGWVYLQVTSEPAARHLGRYGLIALLTIMVAVVVGVLGAAQATLGYANENLRLQADELAGMNSRLLHQIAQREQAEEALRQAQKMEAIGHLTGGVAHDFNNLLQIILASLHVIKRRSADWTLPPKAMRDMQRYMEAAISSGDRAAVLTRQLLAFARRQQLEPTRIDANRLVAGMSELLRRTLGEAIAIETVLSDELWPTFADVNQLENALVNLAVNARDAMPEGGTLIIETANATLDEAYVRQQDDLAQGQYVSIAVTDTGCGMTPDIVAKVFEPFFTTKDVGHGTGLGLSQVYGFVKQSGGHVKIYSEPGTGTRVRLYLPRLTTSEAETLDAAPTQDIPRSAANELILVVEDEAQVRAFSVEMLRELGYEVMEAPNGEAALELIGATKSIRLLFTDVGLPGGMNGRQLADAALQLRPDLKVVFTSGYVRGGDPAPSVSILGKPFTYAALAERVSKALE